MEYQSKNISVLRTVRQHHIQVNSVCMTTNSVWMTTNSVCMTTNSVCMTASSDASHPSKPPLSHTVWAILRWHPVEHVAVISNFWSVSGVLGSATMREFDVSPQSINTSIHPSIHPSTYNISKHPPSRVMVSDTPSPSMVYVIQYWGSFPLEFRKR